MGELDEVFFNFIFLEFDHDAYEKVLEWAGYIDKYILLFVVLGIDGVSTG